MPRSNAMGIDGKNLFRLDINFGTKFDRELVAWNSATQGHVWQLFVYSGQATRVTRDDAPRERHRKHDSTFARPYVRPVFREAQLQKRLQRCQMLLRNFCGSRIFPRRQRRHDGTLLGSPPRLANHRATFCGTNAKGKSNFWNARPSIEAGCSSTKTERDDVSTSGRCSVKKLSSWRIIYDLSVVCPRRHIADIKSIR